jgi:glycosyltransferase involved in cell wall biosynthesis
MRVLLGPSGDLHPGVHGPLFTRPPHDVTYVRSAAIHHLVVPSGVSSDCPYSSYHVGEFVQFGPTPGVVHSSRWPVLQRSSWLVDMDDVGFPLLGGRFGLNPQFQTLMEDDRRAESLLRTRLRIMLAGYAHESCQAVVMRSEWTKAAARQLLALCPASPDNDTLEAKLCVVFPAQPCASMEEVERKWRDDVPRRVVFCGRDFETKNGAVALRTFLRLSMEFPEVEFHYIGDLPVTAVEEYRGSRIALHRLLERAEVLKCFSEAHILFHPSQFESVGLVLLEAAAAGLAVVVGTGLGMEHVREFFDDSRATLVDRGSGAIGIDDEEGRFQAGLRSLLAAPASARDMGLRNFDQSRHGTLSIAERDTRLVALYEAARDARHRALTLADVGVPPGGRVVEAHCDHLAACYARACVNGTLPRARVNVGIRLPRWGREVSGGEAAGR